MSDFNKSILNELDRIQEDAEFSFKGHYNAGDSWETVNFWIGLSTAFITAIASGLAYNDFPFSAGLVSMIATATVTTMTFLNPADRAQKHKTAASYYQILRNQARVFKDIEMPNLNDQDAIKNRFLEFVKTRDQLNSLSLIIPRWAYEKAKKDIEEGRATYRIDKKDDL